MRAHRSLEKDIMLGITAGARKKGKPRMRWMGDIKSVTDLNQCKTGEKKSFISIVYCIVSMSGHCCPRHCDLLSGLLCSPEFRYYQDVNMPIKFCLEAYFLGLRFLLKFNLGLKMKHVNIESRI